jgi:hypothetical protein
MHTASWRLVLLGAGASAPAGVPVATEMTKRMADALNSPETAAIQRALAVIVGGLQMGAGWETQPVSWEVDIESVMNAAELLANRFDADLAPFVGNWHPVLEELERRAFSDTVKKNFQVPPDRLPTLKTPQQAETFANKVLSQLRSALQSTLRLFDRRPDGHLFEILRKQLADNLIKYTWIEDKDKVSYLAPLVQSAAGKTIPIVTLNYDNSVELCADSLGITHDNGISRWNKTHAFDEIGGLRPDCVRLIKLHGSIDWQWESSEQLRQAPADEMETAKKFPLDYGRQALSPKSRSAIIFGGKNKLTAEGPFLDLLFWFRQALQRSNELLVIGYSFRDDHVNHCILSWLRASNTNRLIVITRSGSIERGLFFRSHLRSFGPRLTVDSIGAVDGIQTHFPVP